MIEAGHFYTFYSISQIFIPTFKHECTEKYSFTTPVFKIRNLLVPDLYILRSIDIGLNAQKPTEQFRVLVRACSFLSH